MFIKPEVKKTGPPNGTWLAGLPAGSEVKIPFTGETKKHTVPDKLYVAWSLTCVHYLHLIILQQTSTNMLGA